MNWSCGRAHRMQELAEVANMIASVIDVEASKMAMRQAAGAAKHICVREGVEDMLDQLRQRYAELPALLQQYADYEAARLTSFATIHRLGDSVDALTICYVPQASYR